MSSVTPPPPPGGSLGPVSPGGGPTPDARLPWEDRGRLGVLEALVQTVRLLASRPGDGFARLRPDGDLASPLLFGVVLTWLGMVLHQLWSSLFQSALRGLFGSFGELDNVWASPSLIGAIVLLAVWPVVFVVGAFLGAAVLHGCLLLVAGLERSEFGFEGTLKVYLYSMVSWIALVIPVAGNIVASLWSLALMVIGLAEVHRTTQGRALFAVLIPLLLCCMCGLIVAALFGTVLMASLQQMAMLGVSP